MVKLLLDNCFKYGQCVLKAIKNTPNRIKDIPFDRFYSPDFYLTAIHQWKLHLILGTQTTQ